jgi:cytidylate kinase
MNCIIAFSGMPQTGKTTLARRLGHELKCKFVSFGDFVRQQANRRGIRNPTRRDLQDLGQRLVRDDVKGFCREALRTVNFMPGEQIVIDGVRHKEVLEAVSIVSPQQPIKLIYLAASVTTRKARTTRNLDLDAIDAHEVESQVQTDVKALADFVIDTEGDSIENFHCLMDWIRTNT